MDFFVNGEKLDITLQGEKTIGDVLRSFEVSCEQNKLATVSISVDGINISADQFDEVFKNELKDNTKIEVNVISEEAIKESFRMSAKEITDVIELLKNVPVEMQSGKDVHAKQTIIKLSDVMKAFCNTITWSSLFPETFGSIKVGENSLSEFLADLSPILKDFSDALENSDSVLIGDLAEYEICPRLESLSQTLGSF